MFLEKTPFFVIFYYIYKVALDFARPITDWFLLISHHNHVYDFHYK